MATLPGLSVGLTLNSATFIAETRRVESSVTRLGQHIQSQTGIISTGFARAGTAVKAFAVGLVAAVGAGAIRGLTQLSSATLDTVGNLGELSRAAGVTTRELQVLGLAGVQAGVSQEQLVTALGLFARNVGDAAAGTGRLKDTLEKYGIAIRNSSGEVKSSGEVLRSFAEVVRKAGSEQEKLALLQEAFGRSGRIMINILAEGEAGLDAFAAQAEAAGLIISDELIAKADRASDAIEALKLAVQRGFQIGLIQAFGDGVSSTTENLERARQAGEALGKVVGTAIHGLISAFERLQPFLETTVREFNAIKDVLQEIGVAGRSLDEINAKIAQLVAQRRELSELAEAKGLLPAETFAVQELNRQLQALEKQRAAMQGLSEAAKPLTVDIVKYAEATDDAARETAKLADEYRNLITTFRSDPEADRRVRQLQAEHNARERLAEQIKEQEKAAESLAAKQARATELAAERAQDQLERPFINAFDRIQETMVDTFERIFNGGVTSFSELASSIKDIFIRLAAELAVLMIIRPQVALAGLSGIFGAAGQAGQASQFGGLANVGQPGAFAGLTQALNSFGAKFGFATPASQPALPGAQPGDITGFVPSKAGTFLGTNATLSQTLGAGAIGVVGGTIVGGLFGGQGAIGGGIGGGIGAGAGFALGGPVGALIGGAAGSLLGGAIGSLFGGGNDEAMGSLRFESLRASPFTGGPFGGFRITGEDAFAAPLADMIRNFDKNVAEFLSDRQIELAERAVQALAKFDKRFPEADPSQGFAQILETRARTVLKAAFPDLKIDQALEGVSGTQDIAERVQKILETIKTYNELIGTTSPGIEAARNQLSDLHASFAEVREGAKALGLSVRELNRAEREAVRSLRQGVQDQIDELLSGGQSQAAAQFRQEMQALRDRFDSVRDSAIGLGLSIEGLGKAEREAAKQLRQAARQRITDAIKGTPSGQINAEIARINAEFTELKNLARELPGTTRSTIQALNEAQAEARQAVRGAARQTIFELIASAGSGGTGTAAGKLRSDLAALEKAFDEARAQAAQLTFAININAQLNAAEATARRAIRDEARAQIDDLLLGSDAVGEYRRELQRIQEQYEDAKALAQELGISITALNTAQRQASKDFADAAKRDLENQALGISRQFDVILNPLREFQQELRFSIASPVEQFRLARQEFERIAALARGGDLAAIAALPQAGRLFLEQATTFGASPGRVAAEQQIQTALSGVIQATTKAQADATRGLEAEIRRASDREIDTLREMIEQGRETVRELQRLRTAISQGSRTA